MSGITRPHLGARDRPRILLALHTYANSYIHLPALLAEAGFAVDLIARPGNPVLASRCVDRRWRVASDDLSFAAQVKARLASGNYDTLQLGDEPALLAMYRAPDTRPPAPFLALTDPLLLEAAGGKTPFISGATKWAFLRPAPTTHRPGRRWRPPSPPGDSTVF